MSDRLAALLAGKEGAGRNPFLAGAGLGLSADDMAMIRASGLSLPEIIGAGLGSLFAGGYMGYEKQAAGASPLFGGFEEGGFEEGGYEEGGYGSPVFSGRRHRGHRGGHPNPFALAAQQAMAAKYAETVARNTPIGMDLAPREERRFPFALNSEPQYGPSGIAAGATVQINQTTLVRVRFYKVIMSPNNVAPGLPNWLFANLAVGVDVMAASLAAIDAGAFGAASQENGVDFRPCEQNTPISVYATNQSSTAGNFHATLWGRIQK